MDLARVEHEIDTLQDRYRVKWSLDKSYVMLIDFDYPDGWDPREAPLFFSLHDAYPQVPPLVYLPPEMTFHGSRPVHQHTQNRDDWWQWCIQDWHWRPRHDDLLRATETMRQSLANPSKSNVMQHTTSSNVAGLADLFG